MTRIASWLWWLVLVVVVMFFVTFAFRLSPVDPLPSAVTCVNAKQIYVNVGATRGYVIERDVGGCTFYFFEVRGGAD